LNNKLVVLSVALISATLVGSLYTYHYLYHPWGRKVFTFPPEVQKVVNGTAIMEVSWRWLPETLEIVVKVNDDEANTTYTSTINNVTRQNHRPDVLCFLFDSDNNGRFSNWDTWHTENDHCVGIRTTPDESNHTSAVEEHYFLDKDGHISPPAVYGIGIYTIAYLDNSTSWTFKQGEGYTFTLSIPLELINVKHPTTVQINAFNGYCEMCLWFGELVSYEEARVLSTLVAELEM
jgi:hypothetical protein